MERLGLLQKKNKIFFEKEFRNYIFALVIEK
jgi:hypothetical protein